MKYIKLRHANSMYKGNPIITKLVMKLWHQRFGQLYNVRRIVIATGKWELLNRLMRIHTTGKLGVSTNL